MPAVSPVPDPSADPIDQRNMTLLIQLRWIAVAGQIATITCAQAVLHIPLPLPAMTMVLSGLVGLNLVSYAWLWNGYLVNRAGLMATMLLDVGALTTQLWLSGGATNPFVPLFLLQVTISAVLLSARETWIMAATVCICFAGLTVSHRPLDLGRGANGEPFSLYLAGLFICFVLNAGLILFFVTRITQNLRERDARLAELRQRTAEEDHIVRMGLLAAGAAHEMSTPLSSLAVILGDWEKLPQLRADPELQAEIQEMQTAVRRCKSVLTGVLLSAGEARADGARVVSVTRWIEDLASDWRLSRQPKHFSCDNGFDRRLLILADESLKQVVFNLLDNALEASPDWVRLTVTADGDAMTLSVLDRGPGFREDILKHIGKPYTSTKNRAGAGLGLFLVVNVARKLGGQVEAENVPEGGAQVRLRVPLGALMTAGDDHGD